MAHHCKWGKDYCTFSETILRSTPPKGYKLYDKGLQRVMSVEGESKARSGDKADYKEYRSIKRIKPMYSLLRAGMVVSTDQAQGERDSFVGCTSTARSGCSNSE